MERLAQSFKIALGLVAFVAAGLLIVPQQPTLFTARSAPAPQIGEVDGSQVAKAGAITSDASPAAQPSIRAVAPAGPRRVGGDIAINDTPRPAREAPPVAEPVVVAAAAPPAEPAPQPLSLQELTAEPAPLDLQLFRRPVATDVATLVVDDVSIRIAGVEPLPLSARCSAGAQSEPCGAQARTAVRSWLRGRSVLCSMPSERENDGAMVAPCLVGEEDIGEWIVANGWAEASSGSRYKAAEERARAKGVGIWGKGDVTIAVGN